MLAPCSWADWAVRNSWCCNFWCRTNQVEEVHVYGDEIGRDRSLSARDSMRQDIRDQTLHYTVLNLDAIEFIRCT